MDPLGPGATLGLLHVRTFSEIRVNSKLKGNESHTFLHPTVDDVPAGHC